MKLISDVIKVIEGNTNSSTPKEQYQVLKTLQLITNARIKSLLETHRDYFAEDVGKTLVS
jgi:hypothetical protein